jgi:hypothetical protein
MYSDSKVFKIFIDKGLDKGFVDLPFWDFRKLNVYNPVALNKTFDREAADRDNLLSGQGQVTNVISVGPSKIYFIKLNNDTQIASINLRPGNREYVVTNNNAYTLSSLRELPTFLKNNNTLEPLPPKESRKTENSVDVPKAFINKGLGKGFADLPLEDFAKLNVAYGFASKDISDIGKGAFARNKYLAGQGQVTDVLQVGYNRIYFIKLNNANQDIIASIKIQPGNKDYVVTSQKAFLLNSPNELTTFLKNNDLLEQMKNLKENMSEYISKIYAMLDTKVGQEDIKNFIDDNSIDGEKLVAYVRQHKGTPKQYIIADVIAGKNDPKLNTVKQALIKKCKNKMTKEGLKNYIRETLKKRLAENQPAPSRENPGRETETIPDRGTEEEKRRRIGNPDVSPKPKAMNENEQEIIKQIVARFKSKK